MVFYHRLGSTKRCSRRAFLGVDLRGVAAERSPVAAYCDAGGADGNGFIEYSPAEFGAFPGTPPREGSSSSGGGGPRRLRCHPTARPPARSPRSSHDHLKLHVHPLARPPAVGGLAHPQWVASKSGGGGSERSGCGGARCEAVLVSDGRPETAVARHEATERAGKRPQTRRKRAAAA